MKSGKYEQHGRIMVHMTSEVTAVWDQKPRSWVMANGTQRSQSTTDDQQSDVAIF